MTPTQTITRPQTDVRQDAPAPSLTESTFNAQMSQAELYRAILSLRRTMDEAFTQLEAKADLIASSRMQLCPSCGGGQSHGA